MNAKQIIAAVSLALAGNLAMAIEGEQFNPEPSTPSIARVQAEVGAAPHDGLLMSGGEATVFVDRPVAALRSRAEVRAEARAAAHDLSFDELYVG